MPNLIIANTDKGLVPCVIELQCYIKDGLDHLSDATAYRIITEQEAQAKIRALSSLVDEWVDAFEPHPPHKRGTITDNGSTLHLHKKE